MDAPPEPASRPGSDPPEPSEAPSPTAPSPTAPPPEPVQRWRVTFARDAISPDVVGRAAVEAWQTTLAVSGLAVSTHGSSTSGRGRARFVLAAPLPAAHAGRAELADIWLLEPVPAWKLRESLAARLPAAHRWVGAENIWLGAPALPGQVVAAEWTVTLAGRPPPDRHALAEGARAVLESTTVPRQRAKAGETRPYDLRPLLSGVDLLDTGGGRVALRMVTRLHPTLGTGRPEEVVAAIGEAAGLPAAPGIDSVVRDRLILAEPGPPVGAAVPSRR